MNLRKDLASKSPPVATVSHGERLDLLETRRRFAKVRTPTGVVGWTDLNLLLNEKQMDELRRLAEDAARLPSEGAATVYEAVNMHAEPNRQSPSFFQIPEAGSVDVIAHRATPRVSSPARSQPPSTRRIVSSKKARGKESKRAVLDPPAPAHPSPPRNWEELSRPRATDIPGEALPAPTPVLVDDWNLVRTRDGRAGWVLARMLTMSVPDEVAQYAEGHRITAYVSLGDVTDGNQTKHNWLWTTASSGLHDCDFDSFRVFVWSTSRRRYETAYIERNVKGYFPVETKTIPGDAEKAFSLVVEDRDRVRYKHTYAFSGYRVRLTSKSRYDRTEALPEAQTPIRVPAPTPAASSGWRQRLQDWWRARTGR